MSGHSAGVFSRLVETERSGDARASRPTDKVWPEDEALANALRAKKQDQSEPHTVRQIPSGAVYLGQMMVHDLVLSLPTGIRQQPFDTAVARPFLFDSLYGPGPGSAAHLYENVPENAANPHIQGPAMRTRFREARFDPNPSNSNSRSGPDLFRFRAGEDGIANRFPNETSGRTCAKAARFNGLLGHTETLVADQRNDSHTIVAQLTAIWQRFHNYLFDLSVEWLGPGIGPNSEAARAMRFAMAQNAVRRNWHQMIKREVLPWIIGDAPVELSGSYQGRKIPPWTVRVALRTLHVLPRNAYVLNDKLANAPLSQVLDIGSHSPTLRHFGHEWAIDWTKFFDPETRGEPAADVNQRAANRTCFETAHAIGLLTPKRPRNDPEARLPVLAVDLMRSRQMRESAGGEQIPDSFAQYLPNSLRTQAGRRDKVLEVLNETAMDEADKQAIANDPPLALILLLEAQLPEDRGGGGGANLGPLGSGLLSPWLPNALAAAEAAVTNSEFVAPQAPMYRRFLDIVDIVNQPEGNLS